MALRGTNVCPSKTSNKYPNFYLNLFANKEIMILSLVQFTGLFYSIDHALVLSAVDSALSAGRWCPGLWESRWRLEEISQASHDDASIIAESTAGRVSSSNLPYYRVFK